MKKIFALLPIFCFMLIACNDRNDTTTTESTSNTGTSTNTAVDANANTSTTTDANSSTTNNVVTDEKSTEFLKKATNSGMAEVQLAMLAQQKATIDAVKNFAAMLERDHSAANQQVKSLADQRHVDVPSTISDDKQKMYNDMQKKTGKAFDKEYISMMVKSHNDGISLFENTRSNASDIDVKNFADKTLPTLKMHLDSAKAIQKRYW
jgi:putative membrane protein